MLDYDGRLKEEVKEKRSKLPLIFGIITLIFFLYKYDKDMILGFTNIFQETTPNEIECTYDFSGHTIDAVGFLVTIEYNFKPLENISNDRISNMIKYNFADTYLNKMSDKKFEDVIENDPIDTNSIIKYIKNKFPEYIFNIHYINIQYEGGMLETYKEKKQIKAIIKAETDLLKAKAEADLLKTNPINKY